MVEEFARALLKGLLDYVLARLRGLLTPRNLADLLGLSPTVQTIEDAKAEVDAAVVAVNALEVALDAGPVTFADLQTAAGHLAAAIDHFQSAAVVLGLPAEATLGQSVRDAFAAADPAGLRRQLELALPPEISLNTAGVKAVLAKERVTVSNGLATIDRVGLAIEITAADDPVRIRLTLKGAKIDLAQALPGLVKAIAGDTVVIAADLDLALDARHGLTTRGGAGPVPIPGRLAAGAAGLKDFGLSLVDDAGREALAIEALLTGALAQVMSLDLQGFGVKIPLELSSGGVPKLGAGLLPKAPTGVAVAINTGPVSGGGSLKVVQFPGGTRYSGHLRLRIGPVDVKAFGVLTDLDDGPVAFAVIISVEFVPAIELGLAFTLNGVGGILGLNVTVDGDALIAGLRTGVMDRLLFPPDPEKAAPEILTAMEAVFPPQRGGFVIGPMASLGWGRPISFVTLKLAVVISLPDPTVRMLGRLRVALPAAAPIIDLNAEIYGEFTGRRILIVCSLVNSRLAFATLSGDFGTLIRFGDDSTFALSAGGFHPAFIGAPPELAGLRRLVVDFSPPLGLQLRAEGYFAVTPNTLQLGGRVEVGYTVGVAGVHGYLELHALVVFDPFGFTTDVRAGVSVEALGRSLVGVDLALHLEGPAPWVAEGNGKVKLPWPLPDPSIHVGPIQWGEKNRTLADPVDPLSIARTALSAPAAWSRVDPAVHQSGIRLREVPAAELGVAETATLVEPDSALRGVQNALPLDTQIVKIGAAPVAGDGRIVVGTPTLGPDRDGVAGREVVFSSSLEAFPMGQYVELTDDEALSAPAFTDCAAGVVLNPGNLAGTVSPLEAELRYETTFPSEEFPPAQRVPLIRFDRELALQCMAVSRAGHASPGYATRDQMIGLVPVDRFDVVDPATLVADAVGATTWVDARERAGSGLAVVVAGLAR